MYGYAASALRFSPVNTVSRTSAEFATDWCDVSVGIRLDSKVLCEDSRFGEVCESSPRAMCSSPEWYGVERLESNPIWNPFSAARTIGAAGVAEETVDFLHPIDATAVMRGSSGLPCSTRSVC
jgi:hypothetical protein